MNRRTWIFLGVLALSLFMVGIWIQSTRDSEEELRIGAILPLSGSASPYGENAQRGIDLAVSEINAIGGVNGKLVRVYYEDSRTDPREAVSALQRLHDFQGIRYIIGDINSTGLLAMAPIAERNQILLLSPGASNPQISDAGEFIFRNWHSDALEGQVAAGFARDSLDWTTVAVLYVNAAYGVGLAETFRDGFLELGGEVVGYESYPQDAVDMREQINRILSLAPDGLYLPGWPKEMAVALRQLREQGSGIPVLSGQGFDDPSILELAGAAAEGVMFSVPQVPNPSDQRVSHFQSAYQSAYDREPGVCSASGYDALRIYADAIGQAGDDPIAVQQYMASLQGFSGADGPISFDQYGDLLKPFEFKTVRDGRFSDWLGPR